MVGRSATSPGACVVSDNGESDHRTYVSAPDNRCFRAALPLEGSTELSLRR